MHAREESKWLVYLSRGRGRYDAIGAFPLFMEANVSFLCWDSALNSRAVCMYYDVFLEVEKYRTNVHDDSSTRSKHSRPHAMLEPLFFVAQKPIYLHIYLPERYHVDKSRGG